MSPGEWQETEKGSTGTRFESGGMPDTSQSAGKRGLSFCIAVSIMNLGNIPYLHSTQNVANWKGDQRHGTCPKGQSIPTLIRIGNE